MVQPPHFTGWESEAQRGWTTFPKPPQAVPDTGAPPWPQTVLLRTLLFLRAWEGTNQVGWYFPIRLSPGKQLQKSNSVLIIRVAVQLQKVALDFYFLIIEIFKNTQKWRQWYDTSPRACHPSSYSNYQHLIILFYLFTMSSLLSQQSFLILWIILFQAFTIVSPSGMHLPLSPDLSILGITYWIPVKENQDIALFPSPASYLLVQFLQRLNSRPPAQMEWESNI